jgi:hypothetical protein
LGASVTFWEATAPVKLPACHGPDTGSRCRLEIKSSKAGIPPATPPNLAARLRSLPAILYMLDPIPVASYSKAPRGLSVLPRVTCIFTGTSVSPSAWPRQRPTRYAIRAGRNLPDKEFRSLSYPPSVSGRRRIQRLPACRHADGTISSPKTLGVRRMASEDSDQFGPLVSAGSSCSRPPRWRRAPDTSDAFRSASSRCSRRTCRSPLASLTATGVPERTG